VLLAACAVAAWLLLRGSEEHWIRQRLDLLASTLNGGPDQNGAAPFLKRLGVVKGLFAEDIVVSPSPPVPEIRGIDNLMGLLAEGLSGAGDMHVAFHDVTVTVDKGRRTAAMTATVTVTGAGEGSRQSIIDAREFEVAWAKVDRKWRIRSVAEVQTLR